ncbi:MAG: UPF0149 family protein [Cellvibrionales bacterium]|nr:UPF0149 family protein [Cellvibrionales bacterium]
MSDTNDQWDFDRIADFLVREGSHQSPSECHGLLSGFIAAGGQSLEVINKDLALFLEVDQLSQFDQLTALFQSVMASFVAKDFEFTPVLLDENTPMGARLEAMALWCQGFLSGFAFAAKEGVKDRVVNETLNDMAAIAQVDTADDELGDDSEFDYANLVEFLRMGAMTIFYECAPKPKAKDAKTADTLEAKSLFASKGSDKLH